ncbi:MAG TPA: amidohydrolase family protein [Candidatus Binatia bacterium]|nr:amidohydrolase family protein [Candidatus Binatia bacterium]
MSSPTIDVHVHVIPERLARLARQSDPWFAACHAGDRRVAGERELLEHLDSGGIERAVVMTWPFREPALCAEANDFVAELQRRHPGRVAGCGIVQPADPGAEAELRRCRRLDLRGVGELNADAQGFDLAGDALGRLAEVSAELDLPWTVHCSEPVGHLYPGKGTATPDRLVRFLGRASGLRVIAAHLGGGLPFYAHMPEIRRLCRTLWFDTAALPFIYRPTALADFVGLVGAGRLLLGTDFPLLGVTRYRSMLEAAGLGEEDLRRVTGGNALDIWSW